VGRVGFFGGVQTLTFLGEGGPELGMRDRANDCYHGEQLAILSLGTELLRPIVLVMLGEILGP
jgi:hypothetical protein